MRVFWSWQSDHLGKISRHFVREALELAIEELNESPDIQEAERELKLDHDRKGVPGSPDLARIILEKIEASDIFVADVTPVGRTDADIPKKLINPNVAIELGYALAKLGDHKLIMIMNGHYASHGDLPFDLRHKAGPIFYNLAPEATRADISAAKRKLAVLLKAALREMMPIVTQQRAAVFQPVAAIKGDPSRYFEASAPLVRQARFSAGGSKKEFRVPKSALLYLRLMPSVAMTPLSRADAIDLIKTGGPRLDPLYHRALVPVVSPTNMAQSRSMLTMKKES